ncbi:hypothetical protein SLEP1_g37206 [Rubroshorea leprosula]|uniref:Integrase catalytic domain-containing protein n=1 Tax=Rubroshorea leprosula TaxID=152421 RepID=A0AAV5KTX9_9ROSI|nr:hypothetical protein SLEP1_g37206 [Rubroshorea leprosula]
MPRNLFVGGVEQDQLSGTDDDERTPTGYATQPEQFQIPTGARHRHPRQGNSQHERPERDAQPVAVVATRNSPALSNIIVPTKPRGTKSYQEGFKIPHLETYDGSGDPDEHLHTYQAIMRIQNANDAMMCKVFPATLKSMAKRWYHKLPKHSIDSYSHLAKLFSNKFASQREIKRIATELMQVHQKEGESLRDYMQQFNKATLDIDNVPDTIYLSALLHGLKCGWFLDDLLENPPKMWNEVNDRGMTDLKGRGISSAVHWTCIRITNILLSRAERTGAINSIGGQSAQGRKAYACQVMTVNKNKPLKRPFEEAEWENVPITFSAADYKRADGEPDVMMPHADPFVATVHIGNHNVNKKYEELIYGFNNQPVLVEGVITLPIYVSLEQRFRMASVSFLVIKMESTFNVILGKATLCELKAVISQPHLCIKFPTPQGVGVFKGNQKMARACYQDIFKKVELAATPRGSSKSHRLTQFGQQTMSISDIEHRPKGVEQNAEPVEPVETVPLNPDILERTVKVGTKLTTEERAELLEFLKVNQDMFAWITDEMPGIPVEFAVHMLSTDPTRRPVVQKRHLFGPEKQAAIDEEIKKLLQVGFIGRVEYFEWVSNPVLVKKPNGKWRMYIDFTNLNEACPKDLHPLPNVEKLVERVARHERTSFLDASSGYHQVQLLLDDQEKTTFYVGDAMYCYVMMPFGLKNASATYQKLVQVIFKLQIGRNIENLCRAQMKLNPLKCTFAIESGKFLGYVVSKKGIEVNPEKVQVVQQMEPPKTIKDVQRLTGRVVALHRFIARLAERCLPFFKALREPKNFQWTDEWVTKEAVSSVLLREQNKHQKPICYVSKVLQDTEQNYPLAEKAAFALVYTARKLRAYFQSHQIVVYTDLPLRKILQKPKLSGRLIGWTIELTSSQDINPQRLTIVEVLDAPSYIDFIIKCQLLSTDPSSPSWTTPLIKYLRSGELPEDPSITKLIKRRAAHFTLLDNQLYKRAVSMPLLRCLTLYEAEYAVREVHEGVCGTHIGGKTLARKLLRHGYYWLTMVEDAQNYVKKYPTCQFNVDDIHIPVELLSPFVKGKRGCIYLVFTVDYVTKWIEAKPLSTTTEKKIEEFLFNSILCRFGIPKWIIADNGSQF